MNSAPRVVAVLICAIALTLSGCGGWAPVEDRSGDVPDYHLVKRGENLIRIAWRYGLDYRDIAAWNNLASPDLILAGQRLRLSPPSGGWSTGRSEVASRVETPRSDNTVTTTDRSKTAGSGPSVAPGRSDGDWDWPTRGELVGRFNPGVPGGKGIQIGGTPGQTIRAASSGEIVYKGSGLRGYGRLIIVKHSESLLSAYGYLGRMYVEEGDSVDKGQAIAELGSDSNPPVLHFEIRRNGKPVDPMRYLPG